ncbi:LOW QUALITY PROTEIN: hypothetical protein BKA80DRAFT_275935 [Phyllosticta citrichinensis]
MAMCSSSSATCIIRTMPICSPCTRSTLEAVPWHQETRAPILASASLLAGRLTAARVALAVAKGQRSVGQSWTYHSLVSRASEGGRGGFVGTLVEEAAVGEKKGVRVEVSGWANYTGVATWVVEEDDDLGEGFDFEALGSRSHQVRSLRNQLLGS